MKANHLPITNFLQAPNVQFVIPVYQRNYDWTTTECKDLINDIISVEAENRGTHFIGVLLRDNRCFRLRSISGYGFFFASQ